MLKVQKIPGKLLALRSQLEGKIGSWIAILVKDGYSRSNRVDTLINKNESRQVKIAASPCCPGPQYV